MKATLEFTLPEERAEFDTAVRGHNYFGVIWDYLGVLRHKLKYEENLESGYQSGLESARKMLIDILQERGLDEEF